jgi:hypothetical protein
MSKTLIHFTSCFPLSVPASGYRAGISLVAVAGSSGGEGNRELSDPSCLWRLPGPHETSDWDHEASNAMRTHLLRSSANSLCCNAVQPGLI